jgi:hypothetical protein
MILFLVKLIHFVNDFFLASYIFFFKNNKYDIYYSLYFFIIQIHWIFLKNECLLSYFEKKIKNKNYKLGNRPYNLPHRENFKYIFYIMDFLKYINIFVIIGRNLNNWKILLINIINIILRLLFKFFRFNYL